MEFNSWEVELALEEILSLMQLRSLKSSLRSDSERYTVKSNAHLTKSDNGKSDCGLSAVTNCEYFRNISIATAVNSAKKLM